MDETTLTEGDVTTEYGSERSGWISAEADDTDATDADTDADTDTDDSDTDASDSGA